MAARAERSQLRRLWCVTRAARANRQVCWYRVEKFAISALYSAAMLCMLGLPVQPRVRRSRHARAAPPLRFGAEVATIVCTKPKSSGHTNCLRTFTRCSRLAHNRRIHLPSLNVEDAFGYQSHSSSTTLDPQERPRDADTMCGHCNLQVTYLRVARCGIASLAHGVRLQPLCAPLRTGNTSGRLRRRPQPGRRHDRSGHGFRHPRANQRSGLGVGARVR